MNSPAATTTRRAVSAALADCIDKRKNEIIEDWCRRLLTLEAGHYQHRNPAEVTAWTQGGVDALVESLRSGTWAPIEDHAERIGHQRRGQGFDIGEVSSGLVMLKEAITPLIVAECLPDPKAIIERLSLLNEALRHLLNRFAASFTDQMVAAIRSRAEVTEALLRESELADIIDVVCQETRKTGRATGSALFLGDDLGRLKVEGRSGSLPRHLEDCLEQMCLPATTSTLSIDPVLASGCQTMAHTSEPVEVGSMLLPLRHQDDTIGAILLMRTRGTFSHDDFDAIAPFIGQAALAVEHARMHRKNERMAAVEERQRLARELHDSVTQTLYGLLLSTTAAVRHLEGGHQEAAAEELCHSKDAALGALREMRLLIYHLRPPILESRGLVEALRSRLTAVEERSGLHTTIDFSAAERYPRSVEEALYGVAVEALNNTLNHANAEHLRIRLCEDGAGGLLFEITDDGQGLGGSEPGLGLRGMRERVAAIGAVLNITSQAGKGTRIEVRVPPTAVHGSSSAWVPPRSSGEAV